MRDIKLLIPESEFERLNVAYPATAKSWTVGARTIEIVEFYFRTSVDAACQILRGPSRGIDLQITHAGGVEQIEVKGTASSDLAWGQLKVSGQPSYENLLADTPLYRVVSVYERDPIIYVMTYSDDFDIVPEPRWRLKAKRPQ